MQFVLAKLLVLLVTPANWIIAGLLLLLIIRSKTGKKKTGIALLVFTLLVTNPWLYRMAVLSWQPNPVKIKGNYPAAILPGGLSGYDREGKGYFGQAADRFIQTANLFHEGVVNYIIVTGGNGHLERNYPPEATFLKEELIRNGVPANRILVDDKSRNTRENAIFTKLLADSMQFTSPCVLVTSAMHMRRCSLEFSNAGIRTIGLPCNYEVIHDRPSFADLLWPDLSLTDKWGRLIKEWIGFIVAKYR
jgi:uncharacterized SAM-binding protein YcdF (DUF218 family)